MDWRQLIIDHPALAMLVVFPMVGTGLVLKLVLIWLTGHGNVEPPEQV